MFHDLPLTNYTYSTATKKYIKSFQHTSNYELCPLFNACLTGTFSHDDTTYYFKAGYDSVTKEKVHNEIMILKSLQEYNYVPAIERVIETENYSILITKYVKGTRLNKLNSSDSRWKKAITLALDTMHQFHQEQFLNHNSYRLDNIIVTREGYICVTNFEQACFDAVTIKYNLDLNLFKGSLCWHLSFSLKLLSKFDEAMLKVDETKTIRKLKAIIYSMSLCQ